MYLKKQKINAFYSLLIIFSILLGNFTNRGEDMVTTDDMSGGASVFVFRHSVKTPQFKSNSQQYFLRNKSFRRSETAGQSRKNISVNNSKTNRQANNGSKLSAKNEVKRKNSAIAAKNKLSKGLTVKADTLLKNKETDNAIAAYQTALKKNPRNRDAKNGLVGAYIAKGDEVFNTDGSLEAKSFYDEAIKLDQTNFTAYTKLARMFEVNKLNDEAVLNYEKALAINSALSEVLIPTAKLYYQKGDIAKAESYLLKAENNKVSNSETSLLRGMLYLKQNKNNEALTAFDKVLNIDPSSAEANYYQAIAYDQLNRKKESVSAYRKTVELDPKFTEAWFDLAALNYNEGNYTDAVNFYKKVISLDNNHPDAHANLASAFRQLERYAEANSEYKFAAEYIKNDTDLFSEWGFCLGKVNDWDKAIARLQTANDLTADAINLTNLGWAYLNAAEKISDTQNTAKSQEKLILGKEVLQKAVELNPQFDAALLNLGIILNKLGDHQNAVNTLVKANKLRQKWVIGTNELGIAYRKLNKFSEAIGQFQKVIEIDNKFAVGYFNLGEAQYKSGKKKDAGKTLDKLKALNPDLAVKLNNVINGSQINVE